MTSYTNGKIYKITNTDKKKYTLEARQPFYVADLQSINIHLGNGAMIRL